MGKFFVGLCWFYLSCHPSGTDIIKKFAKESYNWEWKSCIFIAKAVSKPFSQENSSIKGEDGGKIMDKCQTEMNANNGKWRDGKKSEQKQNQDWYQAWPSLPHLQIKHGATESVVRSKIRQKNHVLGPDHQSSSLLQIVLVYFCGVIFQLFFSWHNDNSNKNISPMFRAGIRIVQCSNISAFSENGR